MVVTLSLVLGATAGVLRILDALPGRLRHEPPGVRRVASVEDAERVVGARLWLPAYFPDSLRWPPATVTVHAGPPPAVTLAFEDAAGEVVLLLVESLARRLAAPPPAPAAPQVLQVRPVVIGDAEATLSRFVGHDGRVWHDLAWTLDGRSLVLRSRGPAEDLVRIGGSIRSRGGREP
jgi:hypothetical protein